MPGLARMQPPRRALGGSDGGAPPRVEQLPDTAETAGTPDLASTRLSNTSSGKAVMEIAKKQKLKLREEQRRLALEAEGEGNAVPPATPTRKRAPEPSPKPSPSSGLARKLAAAHRAANAVESNVTESTSPEHASSDKYRGVSATPLTLAGMGDAPLNPAGAGGPDRSFTLMMQAAGMAEVQPISAAALAARGISEGDELSIDYSDEGATPLNEDGEATQESQEPHQSDRVLRLRETSAQDRSHRKLQLQEQLDAQKAALAERRSSRDTSATTSDKGTPVGGRGRGIRGRGVGAGSGRGGLILPRGSGRGPPGGRGRGSSGGSVRSAHEGARETAAPATPATSGAEAVLAATVAQQPPRPARASPKKARGGGIFACCGAPASS